MSTQEKIVQLKDFKEERIKLENIFLDPNNPRFYAEGRIVPETRISEASIQKACIEKMEQFDIEELKENIRRIGFLPIDKIVIRHIGDGKYVVVEGNRRLAALKTLKMEYNNGEIRLSDEILNSISSLDVFVYLGGEKDISWIIQGIRHISGIKDWPPFQQAKLLAKLIEEKGLATEDAAKSVGIGPRKASRLLRSYYGYLQSLKDEEFGDLINQEKFSFFQEAIFRALKGPLPSWLEWDDREKQFKNSDNLSKFLSWIVEYEGRPARITRAVDARDVLNKAISQYPELFRKFESSDELTIDHLRYEIWKSEEAPKEIDEWLEALKGISYKLENLPNVKVRIAGKKADALELLLRIQQILAEQIKALEE